MGSGVNKKQITDALIEAYGTWGAFLSISLDDDSKEMKDLEKILCKNEFKEKLNE